MHVITNFIRAHAYPQFSEETIQIWLLEEIARTTGLRPSQIDITRPFSAYGINSVAAAALSAELANWLGEPVEPTITWDYPTVKLLANHLALTYAGQWTIAA
jgi:acyl carrier protein